MEKSGIRYDFAIEQQKGLFKKYLDAVGKMFDDALFMYDYAIRYIGASNVDKALYDWLIETQEFLDTMKDFAEGKLSMEQYCLPDYAMEVWYENLDHYNKDFKENEELYENFAYDAE